MLTSPFNAPRSYGNKKHEGSDYDIIGQPPDSSEPVFCGYDGTVYRSENKGTAYGEFVVTEHENNGFPFYLWYCHMDKRFVEPGQVIKRGDPVGELGATGGNWGEHVHLNLQVPGFGLAGYVVPDVVDPAPFVSMVPVSVPPPSNKIDLLPYLRGNGRQYTVRHGTGQQENFQTQTNPGLTFDLVKNSQYESFMSDELYIWRGLDTSPGPAPDYAERPGQLRYYRQFEPGQQWARWCKRHMAAGETWTGPGHTVQFGYKADCAPSSANSGNATNKVTFVAKHAAKTWNGVTVNDVVELLTGTGETMFFGRDWGLVAWSSVWGSSAVWELLPAGTPPLVKETGCFSQ